jgi:hypothetical protein
MTGAQDCACGAPAECAELLWAAARKARQERRDEGIKIRSGPREASSRQRTRADERQGPPDSQLREKPGVRERCGRAARVAGRAGRATCTKSGVSEYGGSRQRWWCAAEAVERKGDAAARRRRRLEHHAAAACAQAQQQQAARRSAAAPPSPAACRAAARGPSAGGDARARASRRLPRQRPAQPALAARLLSPDFDSLLACAARRTGTPKCTLRCALLLRHPCCSRTGRRPVCCCCDAPGAACVPLWELKGGSERLPLARRAARRCFPASLPRGTASAMPCHGPSLPPLCCSRRSLSRRLVRSMQRCTCRCCSLHPDGGGGGEARRPARAAEAHPAASSHSEPPATRSALKEVLLARSWRFRRLTAGVARAGPAAVLCEAALSHGSAASRPSRALLCTLPGPAPGKRERTEHQVQRGEP